MEEDRKGREDMGEGTGRWETGNGEGKHGKCERGGVEEGDEGERDRMRIGEE